MQLKEPQLGYNTELNYRRVDAKPFVKWAGGKRRMISSFAPYFPLPQQIQNYYEPFLGGGAVFFHLQHPHSYLSDNNQELIELYHIVKNNVEELIEALKKHRNQEEYFYEVRAQNTASFSPVERAARFIFLNKTCYNGLYRVNSKGLFNVPFGKYKNPLIRDVEGLRAASLALQNTHIYTADFTKIVDAAQRHDFIYFDPPYHPLNATSSFTSYTANKFDIKRQEQLADIYYELACRNCYVMLSNSDTPLIRHLYRRFQIIEVQAARSINSNPNGRGKITELLIINYKTG